MALLLVDRMLGLPPLAGTDRPEATAPAVSDRETWMNAFQGDRKIGFGHTFFSVGPDGYSLEETLSLRINTLGMVQDLDIQTRAGLRPDYSLHSIRFEMRSGKFRFVVEGIVTDEALRLALNIGGQERTVKIPLPDDPFLLAGLVNAARGCGIEPGESRVYSTFNPASMSMEPVEIEHQGTETITIAGKPRDASKFAIRFAGMEEFAWVDDNGDVLRESGILGIRMEKTTRADALFGLPVESSDDLTLAAAVPSNRVLENPESFQRLVVRITGVDPDPAKMGGGRQSLSDDVLTIRKESLADLPAGSDAKENAPAEFLAPSPFIQSDHPRIRAAAAEIVGDSDGLLEKARKLFQWTYQNIEKRPVLSMSDAVSTLENGMGDCNEHAMLLAALARAAGVPARVASGLVYQEGRFYYHAWNLLYVGNWVATDAALGQFPADATHIRFALGEQGEQMALMGMVGKIRIEVLEAALE